MRAGYSRLRRAPSPVTESQTTQVKPVNLPLFSPTTLAFECTRRVERGDGRWDRSEAAVGQLESNTIPRVCQFALAIRRLTVTSGVEDEERSQRVHTWR